MNRIVPIASAALCLTLALAACPKRPPLPITMTLSKDVRRYVRSQRLTKPIVLDGKLALAPPRGSASISEETALRYWKASEGGLGSGSKAWFFASDVVVFQARATLPPLAVTGPIIAPPSFDHRLAWVVFWQGSQIGCAPSTPTPYTGPLRQDIELIAADGSLQGVRYRTAGNVCGERQSETWGAAYFFESVPWKVVSVGPRAAEILPVLVRCGFVSNSGDPQGSRASFEVVARVIMGDVFECPSTPFASKITVPLDPNGHVPRPAPLGLVGGAFSEPSSGRPTTLQYFDGRTHTVPASV